jgi:hypothetical protein
LKSGILEQWSVERSEGRYRKGRALAREEASNDEKSESSDSLKT